MVTMQKKRRPRWARAAEKRIAQGHIPRQYHVAEAERAEPEDMVVRRATAQPNERQTYQDRLNRRAEHDIVPVVYGMCLMSPDIKGLRPLVCNADARDGINRPFGTDETQVHAIDYYADWLTAYVECQRDIWCEQARWLAVNGHFDMDEEPEESSNGFTAVRQRLEAMNAREQRSSRASDEYVEAEMRVYTLTGCYGLNLSAAALYCLLQEVEGDLVAYEDALRNSVLKG